MTNIVFGLIGTALWTVVVVAVAVVGAYLFLRNNPNKKAKIDEAVEKVKNKLGE